MTTYFPEDEIEASNLVTSNDGLFQGLDERFRDVVVATVATVRTLIYLRDPKGAMAVPSVFGEGYARPGILWPSPSFEVDPATQYNPDREDERVGDLIIDENLSLVTRDPDGWSDIRRTRMWPASRPGKQRLGFRGWRMVKVTPDERRILYTQSSPAPDEAQTR